MSNSSNKQDGLLGMDEILATSKPYGTEIRPQVYFLIQGEHIVYIGKTVRADARIAVHAANGKVFDRVTLIDCDSAEHMDALEFEYICKFEPPLNGALHPVPGFVVLDRARKEYGFRRAHFQRACDQGLMSPYYEGRFGTWLTTHDAERLAEIARGA